MINPPEYIFDYSTIITPERKAVKFSKPPAGLYASGFSAESSAGFSSAVCSAAAASALTL
jgi:hypothetical protein